MAREHLGLGGEDVELATMYSAFARSASELQSWHDGGRRGPRPSGRLRPLVDRPLGRLTRLWADPLYRIVYDPDGRPLDLRLRRGL